jgi:DNA-binding response OmpR family regulator
MSAVLLVEDDADIRDLLESAFEEHGLAVRSADADRAAYAILEKEARSFSLLVTDINLGEGTTGFDVAREARRLNPDIKVIYISGEVDGPGVFGVDGGELVRKPFTPAELVDHALDVIGIAGFTAKP